jgi:hypothetical protein
VAALARKVLLLMTALNGLALAAAPTIAVLNPQARASIPGAPTAAVYLTVHNIGGAADRLLGASSPLAARVELHRSQMKDGVASMRALPGIDMPVGGAIELKPGGYHLMLVGLVHPLEAGESLPLTLKFLHAGNVQVSVPVVAVPRQ